MNVVKVLKIVGYGLTIASAMAINAARIIHESKNK